MLLALANTAVPFQARHKHAGDRWALAMCACKCEVRSLVRMSDSKHARETRGTVEALSTWPSFGTHHLGESATTSIKELTTEPAGNRRRNSGQYWHPEHPLPTEKARQKKHEQSNGAIRLMIKTLHYLKDPRLWEILVYSLLWVLQDVYHEPNW